MAETLFAVIDSNNVVENVIVADQAFVDKLPDNIANPNHDTGNLTELHTFIEVTGKSVGVGWLSDGKGVFTAPPVPPSESLVASPTSIPPDSKTASTVTFTALPGATGNVTFSVNGHAQAPVALASGKASIQVASATPNDTITITCGAATTTVTVTA